MSHFNQNSDRQIEIETKYKYYYQYYASPSLRSAFIFAGKEFGWRRYPKIAWLFRGIRESHLVKNDK
jgi:hypothetical protein